MLVEFKRRINHLSEKIEQLKKKGAGYEREIAYFSGALSECESLSYFYTEQMVQKGRVISEKENKKMEVNLAGPNYRIDS